MPAEKPQQVPASTGRVETQPGQAGGHFSQGPSLLHLALIILLILALVFGVVALLKRLEPNGPWRLMPLFALVVATECVLTRRWLESLDRKRLYRYYGPAELIVLLTLAPLFLWMADGLLPFPASAVEVLRNPLTVLSLPLVLYILLAGIVWYRTHSWASWFIQLTITPDEVRFYTSTSSQRASDWSIVPPVKDRVGLLNTFVSSWITGGILLVIASALTSVDLGDLSASLSGSQGLRSVTRLGLGQDTLLALFIYFLGGLWLVSQGRAVVLNARWLANGSQSDPEVMAKWRSWAILIIGGLALLALLLPIGTTYPLLQFIQAVIRLFSNIMSAILAFIAWLIYLVVSILPGNETPERPSLEPGELLRQNPLLDDSTKGAPTLFTGSLFWLALIALAIVATLYVTSDRGPNLTLDQVAALWHRLRRWLVGLGQDGTSRAAMLTGTIRWRLRRPALAGTGTSPFRLPRIGALPPKEQARFLYLSLLRYAGKHGSPRPPSATPIEFSIYLGEVWPDVGPDLEQLTGTFLAARYGAGEIDRRQLQLAKEAWLHIRRRNRQRLKSGPAD